MDEEEIEGIIDEAFEDGSPECAYLVHSKDAAHAIFERLKEGVVWTSEPIRAKFVLVRRIVPGGCDWVEIEGRLMPKLMIPIWDEAKGRALDGEEVYVTVRRRIKHDNG